MSQPILSMLVPDMIDLKGSLASMAATQLGVVDGQRTMFSNLKKLID